MARVDHYVGYPVEALVLPHKPNDQSWKYALVLEGGTQVRFYDGEAPAESQVAGGGKFIMAVMNNYDGSVKIVIGKPDKYSKIPQESCTLDAGVGNYSILKQGDDEIEWFPLNSSVAVSVPAEVTERLQEASDEALGIIHDDES